MAGKWYKLDNAALIYAPSASRKWSCVFRLSCCLKKTVHPQLLQRAVDEVLPRFPVFNVRLRAGFFWYYFDENKRPFYVKEETDFPLQYMNVRRPNRHLFRVLYYGSRISVEFFHGVTDGGGGLLFLKTIVRRYLELTGVAVEGYEGCFNYLDKPQPEEAEDAYPAVADYKGFSKRSSPKAYKAKYPSAHTGRYYLTHGEMDTARLKAAAKAKGCTIGHLLAAAIAYALYLHRENSNPNRYKKNRRRPVVICASMDLRRRFPGHDTLRNFSYFINMPLSDGPHTFDTILAELKAFYAKIDDRFVLDGINSNVRDATRPIVRFLPLAVKNIGLSLAFSMYGDTLSSVALSNFGPTPAPKAFYDHVERFESAIGVAKVGRNLDTSVITFGDKTVLTFCSMGTETTVEQSCFRILGELGVEATVDGNRREFNE